MDKLQQEQMRICTKYDAEYFQPYLELKLGISANFLSGIMPLNGVRIKPEGGTSGWYLWAGKEFSQDADFFQPMHGLHLLEECPEIVGYLALPPGWRFLIAPGYEEVWYDEGLLL